MKIVVKLFGKTLYKVISRLRRDQREFENDKIGLM